MDEQLQYADLLEIPVNTCTITTKKPKKRRMKISPDRLKARAVEKSNLATDPARLKANAENALSANEASPAYPAEENCAETFRISENVDTVSEPVAENAADKEAANGEFLSPGIAETCSPELPQSVLAQPAQAGALHRSASESEENSGEDCAFEEGRDGVSLSDVMDELPPATPCPGSENRRAEKRGKIRAERCPGSRKTGKKIAMISACVLIAIVSAFFLFNTVYLKFDLWGVVTGAHAKAPDDRLHDAFSLVLPAKSHPECKDGMLVITEKGGVYAPADGVVSAVKAAENGTFTVEISHSDRFKTVISGASMAFNAVGDTVYRQQPVAYCGGEIQTTVAFFEDGALLTGLKIENGVPAF